MTPQELREIIRFESSLKPDQIVKALWTWCGGYYGAKAQVERVNKKSVRVRLLEAVKSCYAGGTWPEGYRINVPLFSSSRWSANNRVCPVKEAKSDG